MGGPGRIDPQAGRILLRRIPFFPSCPARSYSFHYRRPVSRKHWSAKKSDNVLSRRCDLTSDFGRGHSRRPPSATQARVRRSKLPTTWSEEGLRFKGSSLIPWDPRELR